MKITYKGAIALAFLVFEFSLISIFLKIGGSNIGIIPQLFYGFLIGFVVSLLVTLILGRQKQLFDLVKNRNTLILICFFGLLNNALTQLFWGVGTLGTNASISAIVYRSWVIMVALLTPFYLKQKVKKTQLLATFIGLLGLYVVVTKGTFFGVSLPTLPFIGAILMASLFSSLSTLFMNKYSFDASSTVVLFNLSSLILITIMALITHTNLVVPFTPITILSVLFLGIFTYGIGTTLYYYTNKVFGLFLVGNVILLVPFLTILLSAVFTNTPIQPYYILSAVLISIGVMIQRRFASRQERIASRGVLGKKQIFDVTSAFVHNKSPEIKRYISGSNRVFVVRFTDKKFDKKYYEKVFSERQCLAFTNKNPHIGTKNDEIKFIDEIMGAKGNDIVLISMGKPENLEDALDTFMLN